MLLVAHTAECGAAGVSSLLVSLEPGVARLRELCRVLSVCMSLYPDEKLGGVSHDCLHSFLRPRPGFDPPGRVCTVSAPHQARVGGMDLGGPGGWDSAVSSNSNCDPWPGPHPPPPHFSQLHHLPALGPAGRLDTGRSMICLLFIMRFEGRYFI